MTPGGRAGFTLTEVVFALLVFAVSGLAAFQLLLAATRRLDRAILRTDATMRIQEVLDSLAVAGGGSGGGSGGGPGGTADGGPGSSTDGASPIGGAGRRLFPEGVVEWEGGTGAAGGPAQVTIRMRGPGADSTSVVELRAWIPGGGTEGGAGTGRLGGEGSDAGGTGTASVDAGGSP